MTEPTPESDTVRAQRFELVDADGNVRGVMACDRDTGSPTCTFLDADGVTRVTIGLAWNEMPSIQLNAPDGTARVGLIVRPEGFGMMLVTDGSERTKVITPESAEPDPGAPET